MSLEQKFSYGDIQKYKHIRYLSASKMRALGRQEMVQCKCFFWHQTETRMLEYLQSQKSFWLCCGSILISMSSVLRFVQRVRFFEGNCTVKSVIFFASCFGLETSRKSEN